MSGKDIMKTMSALVLRDNGKSKYLVCENAEMPCLKPGECLVKIEFAALNHRDLWIVMGLYANIQTPCILGSDGAGTVHSVYDTENESWIGKDVIINPSMNWGESASHQQTDFRILGMPGDGTFAGYAAVPESCLAGKPEHLNRQEAAALPLAGLTAYRALFTQGKLARGQTVLITGIGGGVASMALQYSLLSDAKVIVTSAEDEKIAQAVTRGALAGVNYLSPEYPIELKKTGDSAGGIDLIVDGAGGNSWQTLLDALKPGGTMVTYGATLGKPSTVDIRKIFWKQLTVKGTTMGSPEDFAGMIGFVNKNKIRPCIDSVFDLRDYLSAFDRIREGKQSGKIVLRTGD